MALGARLLGKTFRVYVLLGDGELQEGQPWEAIMAASRWRLDKLTAIVDDNGLQNDAPVGSIMPLRPIADKFRAFGWHAVDIDGHNMKQIVDTLESLVLATDRPTAIIARTVKGKGVSFMENVAGWHGRAPTKEEYEQALAEIGEVANA
jgi:transketolase